MNTVQDSAPPGDYYCPTCEKHFAISGRCPDDATRLVKIATRVDPMLGRELDGRYTIIEKLGQGGMGAVYRSDQHAVGRDVAIKVVNAQLVSDPDVLRRFLREAKLASKLNHPHAVSVLDFSQTDDGLLYLVMELVSGRTLDAVIKAEKILTPERVVRIGAQVCDALEAAHSLSIIHRDLKPANIMLMASARDFVKVLDFGLAKSTSPDQTSTTVTGSGALLGTPAFMPPELAKGVPCDHRADLYSLGCILYLMGSGQLPFYSESMHELIALHGNGVPPPMTDVPPALARVIDKLLAKSPSDRYATAAATREALEAALDPTRNGDPTHPSVGRKPPSHTDLQRLMSQDTMAATTATTGAAPISLAPTAGKRTRWLFIAAPVAIAVVIGIAILGSHRSTTPPAPERAISPPSHVDAATATPDAALPDAAPVVIDAAVPAIKKPPPVVIRKPPPPPVPVPVTSGSGSATVTPPPPPPPPPPPATGSDKPMPF